MRAQFTRLATALALAATTQVQAQAQSLTLDDFDGGFGSQRVYYDFATPDTAVLESTVAAAVPGGTRRLQLTPDTLAPGSSGAAISGSGDLWSYAYVGSQRLAFNLAYGTQAPMNLDLTGMAALHVDVFYSTPVSLVIYASTQTTPGGNPDASAVAIAVPALFRQGLDIPLSSFSLNSGTGAPVNWADVDGLAFFVAAQGPMPSAGDAFWVERLGAVPVPEPASALLLAAGLVVLRVAHRRLPDADLRCGSAA